MALETLSGTRSAFWGWACKGCFCASLNLTSSLAFEPGDVSLGSFVHVPTDAGEEALVVWDESVLEKPESLAAEGLCAVRSMKAAQLKRIKPGYFNPPGGRPICVPGLHWLALLLLGQKGPTQFGFGPALGQLEQDAGAREGAGVGAAPMDEGL